MNTEMMTVPISTSSLKADVAVAHQAFASHTSNMTAPPKAITHIQQLFQIPYHVLSSLIHEVIHEVIFIARAVKNTTPAMESMIGDDQPNESSEEMVNMLKT